MFCGLFPTWDGLVSYRVLAIPDSHARCWSLRVRLFGSSRVPLVGFRPRHEIAALSSWFRGAGTAGPLWFGLLIVP